MTQRRPLVLVSGATFELPLNDTVVGASDPATQALATSALASGNAALVNTSSLFARNLVAGSGLLGGGNLSADRRFDANISSQAVAQSGTDNTALMTPLRVAQAIGVQALTNPAITGTITEDTHAFSSSPDFEIDPANGSIQLLLLTGNHKPKGTNFQNGKKILLFVSDGSGEFPYTIDWTDSTFGSGNTGSELTGVQWLDGAAPPLATSDYTCIELSKAFGQVRGALLGPPLNLRRLPQNSKTSAYTLVASDTGKHISITTGGVTIPASVMGIGDVVTIFNNSTSAQSIVQGSGVTLRKADSTSTGNLSLSNYGIATVLCVAADTFVISGVGLS